MILDDHVLFACILGAPPDRVRPALEGIYAPGVYTTNHFYYRLHRALSSGKGSGTFSGPLAAMDDETREQIVEATVQLPPAIGILEMKTLVPTMAAVSRDIPANVLALEAISAALHLRAPIIGAVANSNAQIKKAAELYDFEYALVDVEW